MGGTGGAEKPRSPSRVLLGRPLWDGGVCVWLHATEQPHLLIWIPQASPSLWASVTSSLLKGSSRIDLISRLSPPPLLPFQLFFVNQFPWLENTYSGLCFSDMAGIGQALCQE